MSDINVMAYAFRFSLELFSSDNGDCHLQFFVVYETFTYSARLLTTLIIIRCWYIVNIHAILSSAARFSKVDWWGTDVVNGLLTLFFEKAGHSKRGFRKFKSFKTDVTNWSRRSENETWLIGEKEFNNGCAFASGQDSCNVKESWRSNEIIPSSPEMYFPHFLDVFHFRSHRIFSKIEIRTGILLSENSAWPVRGNRKRLNRGNHPGEDKWHGSNLFSRVFRKQTSGPFCLCVGLSTNLFRPNSKLSLYTAFNVCPPKIISRVSGLPSRFSIF